MALRSYICERCGGKVSETHRAPLEKVRETHDKDCPGKRR